MQLLISVKLLRKMIFDNTDNYIVTAYERPT